MERIVAVHVLRDDHSRHVGGDQIQLQATVRALTSRGIDAIASTVREGPDHVDIVHLYNLDRPRELVRDADAARARWPEARLVVSPVHWPLSSRSVLASRSRVVLARAAKDSARVRGTRRALRRLLMSADAVLPNSVAETRRTSAFLGIADRSRWTVVPNGIWPAEWPEGRATPAERGDTLTSLGVDPGVSLVVACVGAVAIVKNQLALVEACAAMPDVGVVLMGNPGEPGYARAVEGAVQRAEAGRMAWARARGREDVLRLHRAADIHALVSYRETPGLATLEAAAVGCEVVATRQGSVEEYLGDAAHYAEPWSTDAIAGAIDHARRSPHQPVAGARARSFTWDTCGELVADCYKRTLEVGARARRLSTS